MLQTEVHANRFDQVCRIQLPRAKGRLQPVSDRLPQLLVLHGKDRKKLPQILLNRTWNRRSRFARKSRCNPKDVGTVLRDFLTPSSFSFRSALRQIEPSARFEGNECRWVGERQVLLLVVLLSHQFVIIVVQQYGRETGRILIELYRDDVLSFSEIDLRGLPAENVYHRGISLIFRLLETVQLPPVARRTWMALSSHFRFVAALVLA